MCFFNRFEICLMFLGSHIFHCHRLAIPGGTSEPRILRDIEGTVGIDVFDEQIRRKVREEKAGGCGNPAGCGLHESMVF